MSSGLHGNMIFKKVGWERATREYTSFHMVSKVFDEIEKDRAIRGEEGNHYLYPQKLNMPLRMRRIPSQYHLEGGRALLEENYNGLWKDELKLAISCYPFNVGAGYYYIVGLFPSFMRPALFKLYSLIGRAL